MALIIGCFWTPTLVREGLSFTTSRLADKLLTGQFHVDPYTSVQLMAWACWSVPLLVIELFLKAGKIRRGNTANL